MTQRALLLAALSRKKVRIIDPLRCDDSEFLLDILQQLGARISWEDKILTLEAGELVNPGSLLFCGNAGTAMRFGCCLSLVIQGGLAIDGNDRMRQRPIGPLGDTLRKLGMKVSYDREEFFPPIRLEHQSPIGSRVEVEASISSQFSSGLLMVAPFLPDGLELRLTGKMVSVPYLDMTLKMMARAGVVVDRFQERVLRIPRGFYFREEESPEIFIEPDWSGASFLLAIPLITRLEVMVPGLVPPHESLQGDSVFESFAAELAVGRDHSFDLSPTPDLIAPLVAAAIFAPTSTVIFGAAHTRVKECDRISVLVHEFSKVGFSLSERPDGLEIAPFQSAHIPTKPIELDPHDDHRMAMAFGLASLRLPQIHVKKPECVSKSFPDFWKVINIARQEL